MRTLALALTFIASVASAQQAVEDQSVWERCYGPTPVSTPQPWLGPYYLSGSEPIPAGTVSPAPAPSASPLTGLSSGPGAGYVLLAAAVVAVAALPVVIYVIDKPAPESVQRRFYCPTFSFEGSGGAQIGTRDPSWAGLAVGRFRTGYSYFGTDFQFDASPAGVGSFSFDLLVRAPPKQHLEGALGVGYRRSELRGTVRQGIEFALPHEYVLWRDDERRHFGIELRPAVFVHPAGVDLSVELGLSIPITNFLSARIGSSAFSFDQQVMFGLSTGLALHL